MLEGQGIGIYNLDTGTVKTFLSDDRMIWVDGLAFDNKGHLILNNNRLHELFGGELDWENEYNLIVWKAYLEEDVKAYLYYYQKD